MQRLATIFLCISMLAFIKPVFAQDESDKAEAEYELIIRCDDIGFCHAVNMAIEKVLEEGYVTSVSVIVNGPWLNEAVDILKKHPKVSVGVHLALNSEWHQMKWGPVAPVSEVPSLVDANGKFFGTRKKLIDHRPEPAEVEKELRAQLDLAFRKGLNVTYCDYHMGAAMSTAEFQSIVEKLATEYNIGISRYFGESDVRGVYTTPPDEKLDQVIENLMAVNEPGRYVLVVHPGMNTPEMAALRDENLTGPPNMSEHREAEAMMLCDPKFKEAVDSRFKLLGYSELKDQGLYKMNRPFVAKTLGEIYASQELFSPSTAYK